MERGPHHEADTREIIGVWPPDEAGEVLGCPLDRGPTMRLPKGKTVGWWPPDEAGEVLWHLVERHHNEAATMEIIEEGATR